MKKYRIAIIQTETFFGDPVKRYAVQVRVALFWWVTIAHADQIVQAKCIIKNKSGRKPEKVLKVIK